MSTYEERQAQANVAIEEFMRTYGNSSQEQKAVIMFVLGWIKSNAHLGYRNILSARKNGLLGRIRE